MHAAFELIHNHHEQLVMSAVTAAASSHPGLDDEDLLADVACIALNRMRPRYIRHEVDMAFYQTHEERMAVEAEVAAAVAYAFKFVGEQQAAGHRT